MSASPPKIIGIAGTSASGKSTVATALQQRLPGSACVALDRYYRDISHLPAEQRRLHNYDHPDALDWPHFFADLEVMLAGDELELPEYRYDTQRRKPSGIRVRCEEYLILEGLFALALPELRDRYTLSVFVDVERDIRLMRRIRRDVGQRGQKLEDVLDLYEQRVRPMEDEQHYPASFHAELELDGLDPVEDLVDSLLFCLANKA